MMTKITLALAAILLSSCVQDGEYYGLNPIDENGVITVTTEMGYIPDCVQVTRVVRIGNKTSTRDWVKTYCISEKR
jgi:hypothetical protein